VSTVNSAPVDAVVISAWLQHREDIPADRADAAGRAPAEVWTAGDRDYQTTRDILGDWLTDDEPRPKFLADDLAAHVGLTLT
jgi:hypothetical protein